MYHIYVVRTFNMMICMSLYTIISAFFIIPAYLTPKLLNYKHMEFLQDVKATDHVYMYVDVKAIK